MKKLMILCLMITTANAEDLGSASEGIGLCVKTLIESGRSPNLAVSSVCSDIQSKAHGICAAAVIETGRSEGFAVNGDCRLVTHLAQAYCAAASIKIGQSPYSAVFGPCSSLAKP